MSFDEVRNPLETSFAEGSITEEQFPILNEEYESEGQEYKLKLGSRCFYLNFSLLSQHFLSYRILFLIQQFYVKKDG